MLVIAKKSTVGVVMQKGVEFVSHREMAHYIKNSDKNVSRMLKNYIEEHLENPVRKVVCYEERIDNGGFCETCSYKEYNIDIYYKSINGQLQKHKFNGSMSELLKNA